MKYNYIECGDCLELIKDIPTNGVDVVFTSPPYNSERHKKYKNDKDDKKDYYGFLTKIADECLRVSKKYFILNIQALYYNRKDVYKFIGEYSNYIQRIVIWEKTNPTPSSMRNRLTNSYEFFLIMGDKTVISNSVFMKDIVTTSINPKHFKEHKAVMNKEVSDIFIKEFTQENDVVLDVFMGLGTTALSCIEQGRRYIGFEIDEDYVKIANERIKKYYDEQLSIN